MATRSSRAIRAIIVVSASLAIVACGDDAPSRPSGTTFPDTPTPPAGVETKLYEAGPLRFEYPDDWTVSSEEPPEGATLGVSLESPAGSRVHFWFDGSVNMEVSEQAGADEDEVEYLYAQLFPFGPPSGS